MAPQTDQERVGMAHQLENERAERAAALAAELHQKELAEAERRGRREATVDAKLEQHEIRLNTINGNIARTATALEGLKEHLVKKDEVQDKLNTEVATQERIHWRDKGVAYSQKQVYLALAAILATASSSGIVELVKLIFG